MGLHVTRFQGTDMSHLRAWHCYVRHMAACLPWHLVARKGYSVRCKIIKSFIEKSTPVIRIRSVHQYITSINKQVVI